MSRKEFPVAVRKAAWARCDGHCECCGMEIKPGTGMGPEYDHVNPDALTGEPTIENCEVLCLGCHKWKTKADRLRIAKAHRLDRKARGLTATKAKIGDPRFKRKVSGQTVPR